MDDWQLIQDYALRQSETAFRALVARHAGLVYASALRQVGEASLAEEVSQSVFILLSRKAGSLRRGTVLSGWLFQTTRFVATRAMRSELRRRRREQEAFVMQQLDSNDDVWTRIAPLVDEALADLGGTDRDAILLRYVEGRSLREVSTMLGVTEEAAKKRVSRGVEKLRQNLRRSGTAIPTTVLTAALAAHASATPEAALMATWTAQALTPATAAGGALALVAETLAAWRWIKVKWVGGAALVALIALLLPLVTQEPAPDRASEVLQPATELSIASEPGNVAAANPTIGKTDSKRDSSRRLLLQVISAESGEAVSNAAVFLSVWRLQERDIQQHWDLATDAAGRCDVAYDPEAGRIDVGVMQPGWSARYVTWPSEGSSSIPATYVLKLLPVTNEVGGIVQDSRGNPLPDVQIWFMGGEGGDSSHRERPRERFGFGTALPAVRTDAQGRWQLGFIPSEHRGFQIEGRHPEFADTTLISSLAQQGLGEIESVGLKKFWARQLVSTMDDAFTLTGMVLDEQNRPVAGAKIQRRAHSEVFTSDDAGIFRVPKLPAGEWPFTVTADGFAPVRTNVLMGPSTHPVRIILRPGAVLRLHVVDEDGISVPEAEVGMEQWGENRHDFEWRSSTDFDGRLEWNSAPRDVDLELFARKDGFCYTRDVKVVADGSEHAISIHRSLDVHGRVVDSETGRAVRDFRATPGYGAAGRFSDGELRWYAGSNARGSNGLFKLTFEEKVYPWLLRVTADGYEDWVSEPLTNRIHVALDIAMKRARAGDATRGVVLQPDGTPAVGAQVALLGFDHNVKLLRQQTFSGSARWLQNTGNDGSFSFPATPMAHSVAAVSSAGYAHHRVLDPGQPVTLLLEQWGRVEGVVDASAATHGVVTVELYDPAADNYQGRVSLLGSYSVKPGADGRFLFEHVPPGDFCVFVNSMNNIPFHHKTPLVVRPGETTDVVIREWPGTRITGRFVPPPGKLIDWKKDFVVSHLYADLPPASAFINPGPKAERPMRELEFWTSAAGREHVNTPRVYSVLVHSDGTFATLENLPPGNYRFTTMFRIGGSSKKSSSVTQQVSIGDECPEQLPLGELQLR